MNEFVFQVAVVFIPGLVWTVVVDTLTVAKTKRSQQSVYDKSCRRDRD